MPPPVALNFGTVTGQSVAAGANYDLFVECPARNTLVVRADLSAGASGDIAVAINPTTRDGEVYPLSQPKVQDIGPTLVSGRSYYWGQWDVSAQQRVRIRVTNNNAAPQSLDVDWRLE